MGTTLTAQEVVDRWGGRDDCLIEMFHDIQNQFNHLPEPMLREVAEKTEIPLSRMFQVATFYNAFSLTPKGRYIIGVCTGTPCYVKGAPRLIRALEKEIGISVGETDPDLNFTLEVTGCLGTCGLAPVLMIGEDMIGNLTQAKIPRLIAKYRKLAARFSEMAAEEKASV